MPGNHSKEPRSIPDVSPRPLTLLVARGVICQDPSMGLVYLDNSNLNLIADCRRRNPGRYGKFLESWRTSGAVLAVSIVHYIELGGSNVDEARDARYSVIEDMVPVRAAFDLDPDTPQCLRTLLGREVLVAVCEHLQLGHKLAQFDRHWRGFPITVYNATSLRGARTFEDPDIRQATRTVNAMMDFVAKATARPEGTKYDRRKARNLDVEPPSAEVCNDLVQEALRHLSSDEDIQRLFATLPPEAREEGMIKARDLLERNFRTMVDHGPLEGMAILMSARSEELRGMYTDEAAAQAVVRAQAGQLAAEIFNAASEDQLKKFQSMVSLDDCPGTWLRHKVEVELRKSVCRDVASSQFDLDHLEHMPYVDLFFCDKRMATYVRQVQRLERDSRIWDRARPPVAVPSSVEAIEDAVARGPSEW